MDSDRKAELLSIYHTVLMHWDKCWEFRHEHDTESRKAQSNELDAHDCFITCTGSSNHLCKRKGESVAEKVPQSTCILKDVLTAAEICFNHGNGYHEWDFVTQVPENMRHDIPRREPQWDAPGGAGGARGKHGQDFPQEGMSKSLATMKNFSRL